MSRIFISYRREDSIEIARHIYDELSRYHPKADMFMDVDSVPPGVDFRASIESAIIQSSIVLVVIGPKWLAVINSAGQRRIDNPDDFVRIEIEMALRHNKPLVPLLVQGSTMPPSTILPPSLASLAYRNALVIRSGSSFHEDMQRVEKAIELYSHDVSSGLNTNATSKPVSDERRTSIYAWITWISIASLLGSLISIVAILTTIGGPQYVPLAIYAESAINILTVNLLAIILSLRAATRFNRKDAIPGLIIGTIIFGAVGFPGIMPLWFALRKPKR